MGNKGSINFLVLAVVLAALIIGGAVLFATRKSDDGQPSAPPPVEFTGEKVVLDETYQSCAEGERCIVVDTHCGFCCDYAAVNAAQEQAFNRIFDKNCRRYSGSFCSCFDLSSYPACVEGKCQLVQWPENAARRPATPAAPPQTEAEMLPPVVVSPPPGVLPSPAPSPLPPVAAPVAPPPPQPLAEEPVMEEPAMEEPVAEEPVYQEEPPAQEEEQASPPPDDSLFAPLPDTLPDDLRPQPDPGDPLNKPLPRGDF